MYKKRHHPGLSTFIRILIGVILLLTDSSLGVNIVAAIKKEDRDTGGADSLLVENGDDVSKEEDSALDTDTNSIVDISSLSQHVKKISRSLRGKDPTAMLAAADEGVDNHIEILQSLIKLKEEGCTKDKAATIRSLIGGFKDFNKDMKEGNELTMNPELSKMIESIPDLPLDTFDMDMVVDEQLVDMFSYILGFQDLDQMIEHAEGMKDLARTVTDILSATPGHRRQLKDDDPFEFDYDPFEFGTGGEFKRSSQGHFQPRFNFGSNAKFRDLMKKARDTARQRQYRQRGQPRNQGDQGRRLRINERNLLRTDSLPQCRPTCDISNTTCNCDLLFECVNDMSSYDITVSMINDYIDDDGNYTSDYVDVFDATGSAILSKLTKAKESASMANPTNEDQCMNVLEQFHSTCNPNAQDEVCPGVSDEYQSSFQLTVDQVCNSVDTKKKLLFESIYDAFDSISCGLVRSQKVYVGCDTTYLSTEARQAQCYEDTGCSDADCADKDCATCCTSSNKCYAGQGDCESDDDCQDGFKCGTDNCQLDFGWFNGKSDYDCCEAIYSDESKIIFDSWNTEGTSCGISNGQTVYTGCGYTYLVEEDRNRQCCGDVNNSCGGTSTINIDGWVNPASATDDDNCGSVSFSACAKFAETFDRLYRARPETYPDGNPMLKNPSDTITTSSNLEFYNIMIPISYTFDQSKHGVNDPETLAVTPASIVGFPGEKLVDLVGQNIALGKEATQSSTFGNSDSFRASNAVDGNIDTISHTSDPVAGVTAWWQVDLEDLFEIKSIVIVARQNCPDCSPDRLKDFWIRLIDADGSTIVDEKYITTAVVSNSVGTTYTGWKENVLAHYVRVDMPYKSTALSDGTHGYLHMAEVKVYGKYLAITNRNCLTGQFDYGVAKEAMGSCDDSMALLLGYDLSLGTFIGIVDEVEEKGPDYMPGTCCQDTAITSEYLGVQYDPVKGMECQYPGLWHLGLSSQACENAGGRWFRSPCVPLKRCIDNRPKNGTVGYSQSFENFALGLVIDDPSDEEQCGNTRQGLGFDADYEFDVDVCDEFDRQLCDPSFDGIDDITGDSDPVFTPIVYEPITYPNDPALPFEKLTTVEPTEKVDDTSNTDAINILEIAQQSSWTAFQSTMAIVRRSFGVGKLTCGSIPGPMNVPQSVCTAALMGWAIFWWVLEWISLATWVSTDIAYTVEKQKKVNYSKLNYELIIEDRKWGYESLNTINLNIINQHTTMRDQLQERHEQMVNDINQNTADTANQLGCEIIDALGGTCTSRRRLDSDGKTVVGFEVIWHSEEENQAVSFIEMIGKSINAKIGDGCAPKPRTKGNKKKPKSDKSGSNLFTNEDDGNEEEGSNRDLAEVGFEALVEEKLGGVYDSDDDMKSKMNMIEGKINDFEADIADIRGKVYSMEDKIDKMEDKMDTIIEMMTQLLGQEKLVKE